MPDPQRLPELRRQRALVQEHLAWLEREIAAAEGSPASPVAAAPISGVARPLSPPGPSDPDALLAQFVADEKKGPPSKQGCWILFWLMLVGGGSLLGAIIYFIYR